MARGNIYILIHPGDINQVPPEKTKDRYTWTENIYDEDGNLIDTIIHIPTWNDIAVRHQQAYGVLRSGFYNIDSETYRVLEFETSFVKGEIQQILALGNPGNFPKYAILSASEARTFINNGTVEI